MQLLCQSPLTNGLFQKAVMSSGCGLGSMLMGKTNSNKAFWQELMTRCGCENLEQFRALPVEQLFDAYNSCKKEIKGGIGAVFPVKDEHFVVSEAIAKDIPYMAGSTSHDMAPPLLQSMTKKWIAKREKPSYTWYFDRMLPGDDCGAWHSSDLWIPKDSHIHKPCSPPLKYINNINKGINATRTKVILLAVVIILFLHSLSIYWVTGQVTVYQSVNADIYKFSFA